VAQVIGRRVVSRAAMEARRADAVARAGAWLDHFPHPASTGGPKMLTVLCSGEISRMYCAAAGAWKADAVWSGATTPRLSSCAWRPRL